MVEQAEANVNIQRKVSGCDLLTTEYSSCKISICTQLSVSRVMVVQGGWTTLHAAAVKHHLRVLEAIFIYFLIILIFLVTGVGHSDVNIKGNVSFNTVAQ